MKSLDLCNGVIIHSCLESLTNKLYWEKKMLLTFEKGFGIYNCEMRILGEEVAASKLEIMYEKEVQKSALIYAIFLFQVNNWPTH